MESELKTMNEERNDSTIGNMRTWGASGPFPEDEPREMGSEWQRDAPQTIGGMETISPGQGPRAMLLAGRYRVVKRLGEGGMGSVWLAEDMKLDGRLVAIKMLPAVLAGKKGAYRQVKQEALMAMKLSHPNIATVRAFEEDEGGAPFLVMDYIEGEGLDEILSERGPLGEEEVLKLLGPVAAALDYAHSQGVVHRDVKPGNVMVRKDGTPFVLDFGIAREIQETMTRVTGKFSSGTLLYMSPEQLRGHAPKAAQDVYSFAAMAYECLAGHPPFYRGAVEDQIKNEPPEELEERVASAGLRKGIMAGLAKVPEGRPGTCLAVLRERARIREFGIGSQQSEADNHRREVRKVDGRVEGKTEPSENGLRLRLGVEFERKSQYQATDRRGERSWGLLFAKPSLCLFRILTGFLVASHVFILYQFFVANNMPIVFAVIASLMSYIGLFWLSFFPKNPIWINSGLIFEILAAFGYCSIIIWLGLEIFSDFRNGSYYWGDTLPILGIFLFVLSFALFVVSHLIGKRRLRNFSAWIIGGLHLFLGIIGLIQTITHISEVRVMIKYASENVLFSILLIICLNIAAIAWILIACREGKIGMLERRSMRYK